MKKAHLDLFDRLAAFPVAGEEMDRRALVVSSETAGERLDRWLATQLPGVSRARLKTLIDAGLVRVDGAPRKAAHHVATGERVEVEIPPLPPETLEPEPIALTVMHEDEHVLVLDKPTGMVVHPGAGHARGTLAAAVLAHAPGTAGVGGPRRPGVVHRLDKDTSGLLVIAKTAAAYESLTAQLLARTVRRVYHTVVHGRVAGAEGIVDQAIGRHPHDRTRMAVRPVGRGRRAVTRWRVLERFADFTYLEARLETGRTHQIRVHLSHLGHPVAGDSVYGGRRRAPLPVPMEGLALHAAALAFLHPASGQLVELTSALPARIERLLSHLRHAHSP
ncbi:MAG TPA: RluA family pseudouridine synthase [Patescibacteria group bacterium]|nr:RluA family pseudouridine synthase [Patescibacteria group bacterium]